METMEGNEFHLLMEFLTSDEIDQISVEICKKLENLLKKKYDDFITAKAVFETSRKNLDVKLTELLKRSEDYQSQLKEYQEKLVVAEKYNDELQNQLENSKTDLGRVQESIERLEKENTDLRKLKDAVNDENHSLHSQVERKNIELERLKTEIASLNSQLQSAITVKCEALAKVEEIQSREMSLDFKEKRFEQERTLLTQQLIGLEEELSKRTAELQNTRSETSTRVLLIKTQISQYEEELKIKNDSESQMRETNRTLQQRLEEMTQKLEDQRNHELTMHASYREEVLAQTRLADLYKGMCDEANAKADDYSNAVKELQSLLEHATEQYGELESKHNQCLLNHEQEVLNRQQKIDELLNEINQANELLRATKQERLDQAVEELAPTAAIASKVLKKGLSLTQIYTQLVQVTNQLSLEKEENDKLKSQMEIIFKEMEEKAPILQQQREDYETAVANIATLNLRLDELLNENFRLQKETDDAKKLTNHHTRENVRLKSELADLARQVCYLLKEVQETRVCNNLSTNEFSLSETDNFASAQIISKKLVTFKDIEGLQENNQKLLSIVRTLSSKQEEIEKATDQINSGEMKEKLDRYIEQLSEMQAAQDRQSKMLDGLLKQRDMYKNMYQQLINQNVDSRNTKEEGSNISENVDIEVNMIENKKLDENKRINDEIAVLYKKYQDSEKKLNQISNNLDTYKKEKVAHEKMLNDEIERSRKDAEKNSTRCCRLKAQLDSANERFSLLQGNVTAYKSQIKTLEEKCMNYNTTIGKHEQSLMILKDEALAAQSRLSKAEVQLENLKQERQLLRDSESRLLKEREVLQRERHTHALLKADVEAIKASLERAQAEGQIRMEQRLDDANRECAALRRRLQEEQDRFREISVSLERKVKTLQERLNEEKVVAERIQIELDSSRTAEKEYVNRIDELNAKLKQVASHTTTKTIEGEDNLSKKVKDLETLLVNHQMEIKSLSEQLKAARIQSQQYCDIAESAELQLRETMDQHNKSKIILESNLKSALDESIILKEKVKNLEEKIVKLSNGQLEGDTELKEKLSNAERQIDELNDLKNELAVTKSDLQNASEAAAAAEDKYAREMVLHSADLQTLTKLKEENQEISKKMSELIQQNHLAKETLTIEKSMWQNREKLLHEEIQELQKRVEDLDAQNVLLHNQIQELSERAVLLQNQQSSSGSQSPNKIIESVNRSFSEEDSKSTEQLLQIMKYLRREKDLVLAKFDVLKTENTRLKSQVELTEKRLDETKKILDQERENTEIEIVTTSKHSELLRKVETLNAITDSNRILREERDSLCSKINDLTDKLNVLSNEVIPLREKARDLEIKNESLHQENSSLKSEAMRWRQRANTLVERANKASPEDWRRLQTERENLSKLLTSEREIHNKRMEELNSLRNEKVRIEEQLCHVQIQLQSQNEQIAKITEDTRKLIINLNEKSKDLESLKKELTNKDALLTDIKNKEIQIRKIAKKYKTQYEELTKSVEEEKTRLEDNPPNQLSGGKLVPDEDLQISVEKESQLREEGRSELRQVNIELSSRVDELSQQVIIMQSESENLKKEIEVINKASLEKEERAKQVLKGARTKIMQLTEYKKLCEKEMHDLKEKLDSSASECESNVSEYEARLAALKSQMEGRIQRLEHERSDLQAEKETLLQRAAQLQRQLAGQSNLGTGNTDPPTANIKPMSARAETPLASIRPMSVVVQSRTAAVLPTTAGAPLLLVSQQSQQQLVHTTETSSPTSSHMDYQPASTSRQLLVQPQLNESAESTQREETEMTESIPGQQTTQQQQQCQQLTVALVSPRVEQQQQQQQQSIIPSDQQQTVPSSSTQSVTTSHTTIGHKRPRALDSSASASNLNENIEHSLQEQVSSPKTKRSRQQELIPTTHTSVSDIEYQVPTSSQRDQDEEGEEGCVVVVDCDESGSTNQPQEEEDFENDPYEEIEEEEELPYGTEVEGDNNEVEIIIEDDSNAELSRQSQSTIQISQQQSETISSAGHANDSSSFTRSSRGIPPMTRQQPQQHLIIPQQGYEDAGDDCIVPSTPTLFVPRRNDGFGESVSSPQVPQARFTFGDPTTSTSATSAQSHSTSTISVARTMYSSTSSGLAQVVQEGMDDTRVDLSQLEDNNSGRSMPSTPLQGSPAAESALIISGPHEEQNSLLFRASESQIIAGGDANETILSTVRAVCLEEQKDSQVQNMTDSENATDDNSETNKKTDDARVGPSTMVDEVAIDTEAEGSEETVEEMVEGNSKEESREAEASPSSNTRQRSVSATNTNNIVPNIRGATARRSTRTFRTARGTRPTPIVWDNQSPTRGQSVVRGHANRGSTNESTRVRGARGRRMRPKYPYNY